MKIDPDFERKVVSDLLHCRLPNARLTEVNALLDNAESLLVSLLRQREIMRHHICTTDSLLVLLAMESGRFPGGPNDIMQHRRAQQLLLDVPSNSPMTDDFAGASRTIPKKENEDGLR